MTFEEYQRKSRETAFYPRKGNNYIYPTLGLAGEAGEVAEKIKKVIRDKNEDIDTETLISLEKELGDVLWYVSNLASELGLSLRKIALSNLSKLQSRKDRGKLRGEGDDR